MSAELILDDHDACDDIHWPSKRIGIIGSMEPALSDLLKTTFDVVELGSCDASMKARLLKNCDAVLLGTDADDDHLADCARLFKPILTLISNNFEITVKMK